VEIWLALAGVKALPAVAWQLVQLVAPVWFMVAGSQTVPIAWQLPQLVLVIGATEWLSGLPCGDEVWPGVEWQPEEVQVLAADTPLWTLVAGKNLVVVWHTEHSEVVVMCVQPPPPFLVIGVQLLPALLWQLEQLLAPV
jgi:hypothetical protein